MVIKPPTAHHVSESDYFKNFKKIVKSTKAHVRRTERITNGKLGWIQQMAAQMRGVKNFSLALYKDPIGDEETPSAMSVCRIDNTVAWLIALAEHQATTDSRDIMITDPESIDLISRYYQKRIWERSAVVIEFGIVNEEELARQLSHKN